MNIEAKLMDEGSFLHREFNLIDQRKVGVGDLVILDYEVGESHVAIQLMLCCIIICVQH